MDCLYIHSFICMEITDMRLEKHTTKGRMCNKAEKREEREEREKREEKREKRCLDCNRYNTLAYNTFRPSPLGTF